MTKRFRKPGFSILSDVFGDVAVSDLKLPIFPRAHAQKQMVALHVLQSARSSVLWRILALPLSHSLHSRLPPIFFPQDVSPIPTEKVIHLMVI